MKIISDFNRDVRLSVPEPGGYEWWYFDLLSENGYSAVIIFYNGNPFSKRYIKSLEQNTGKDGSSFPAVSVSVYKEGRPLYYGFEEAEPEEADFSQKHPDGYVKKNRFSGRQEGSSTLYSVSLNQILPGGDQIKGELTFTSFHNLFAGGRQEKADPHEAHVWNLVQPKSRVTGTLSIRGYTTEKIEIAGTGYHDHNTGPEPLKEQFTEWYWGRYHFVGSAFIYYLMKEKGEWKKRAWLLKEGGTMLIPGSSITTGKEEYTLFGLKTARKIEFAGDRFEGLVQLDDLLDNGPFYQRCRGKMVLKDEEEIKTAEGISEYIFPQRITNRLFWPLVSMRISYPGEKHWVQRNPALYRRTW